MDKKLKIIIENCPQNHKCPAVNVCPVGALSQKDFEAPIIDYDKCIGWVNVQISVLKKHWYYNWIIHKGCKRWRNA